MSEPQERHYNIKKLNKLFAIASLILLVSLGAMLMDDYSRKWKDYQRDFRALEVEKTRVKYDEAENQLDGNAEYQALKGELEKAQVAYNEKCSNLEGVETEIQGLGAQDGLISQRLKIAKAELDAAKYRYEEALHAHHGVNSAKGKYDLLLQKVNSLSLDAEKSTQKLKDKRSVIKECEAELVELKRKERTFTGKVDLLKRKLAQIDPQQMSVPNFIANSVRNVPILDLASPTNKIEQIVLKDITEDVKFAQVPRVDRCITCHKGIANPDYKDAPQPFTTHPNLELFLANNSPHPMEEFGCTTCHGGRGRGTDFNSTAHTPRDHAQEQEWIEKYEWHEMHHWETPMFPAPYFEAGCFKCHSGEGTVKQADKLNLGLQLIERAGCYACHAIERYEEWPKPGPDLTHLATKADKTWVYQWIRDPHSFRHNTWMPAFFGQSNNSDPESITRSEQEIHAIVSYLFENSKPFDMGSMPHWGDPKQGEQLVASLGCFGCHQIQNKDTHELTTQQSLRREQGPNLTGLGAKTSKVWLYNWLKDPSRYHADTRMPSLRLSDQEAADIAAYLSEDKNNQYTKGIPQINNPVLDDIARGFLMKSNSVAQTKTKLDGMRQEEKLVFAGEKLIGQYGCYSCHNISGFENYKPIGTELTEEGSKAVNKLDFGFIDIPKTRHDWFATKLKNPRIFDHGRIRSADEKLHMPNYNFTDQEVEAIVTAILGFVNDKPSASKMKPRTPENIYIEQGQQLIKQFNCQGCHLIEDEGGAIQPSVAKYLEMFEGKGETEAKALITSFSPPNLVGEGEKVQPDWLFEFLHEPTTIRPWLKVRMPTYKFNSDHLNVLIKYFAALDDEEFPFPEMVDVHLTPAEYEAGEKLFSKDYFACAQCHIVGDAMPSGSPENWAPDFGLAKKRLKPKWLREWIKNPQTLLPGTKMPTFYDPEYYDESGPGDILEGNEDEQIRVLTNYILTLADKKPEQPTPTATTPTPKTGNTQ